jgi:hypothetical protein
MAMYSVILNLAMTPLSVIFGALGLLGLSFLAHARDPANSRQDPYVGLVWVYATIASAYAILVAGTLDILAPLVFGHRYTVSPSVHLLITLIVWIRINRAGAPTAQMLVDGDTRRLTAANLSAGIGLVLAVALLPLAPRLETVLACVLFGDVLSLAVFFWGVRGGGSARRLAVIRHLSWSFAAAGLAAVCVLFYSPNHPWWRALLLCIPVLVVIAQAMYGFRHHFSDNGLQQLFTRPKGAVS